MESATHLGQSPHPLGDSEHSSPSSPEDPDAPGLVCLPTSLPRLCRVTFQIINTTGHPHSEERVFVLSPCVQFSGVVRLMGLAVLAAFFWWRMWELPSVPLLSGV